MSDSLHLNTLAQGPKLATQETLLCLQTSHLFTDVLEPPPPDGRCRKHIILPMSDGDGTDYMAMMVSGQKTHEFRTTHHGEIETIWFYETTRK